MATPRALLPRETTDLHILPSDPRPQARRGHHRGRPSLSVTRPASFRPASRCFESWLGLSSIDRPTGCGSPQSKSGAAGRGAAPFSPGIAQDTLAGVPCGRGIYRPGRRSWTGGGAASSEAGKAGGAAPFAVRRGSRGGWLGSTGRTRWFSGEGRGGGGGSSADSCLPCAPHPGPAPGFYLSISVFN